MNRAPRASESPEVSTRSFLPLLALISACAAPMTQMGSVTREQIETEQLKEQQLAIQSQLEQQRRLNDVAQMRSSIRQRMPLDDEDADTYSNKYLANPLACRGHPALAVEPYAGPHLAPILRRFRRHSSASIHSYDATRRCGAPEASREHASCHHISIAELRSTI